MLDRSRTLHVLVWNVFGYSTVLHLGWNLGAGKELIKNVWKKWEFIDLFVIFVGPRDACVVIFQCGRCQRN